MSSKKEIISEIITKFDSIQFDISDFKSKDIYSKDAIKAIDDDLEQITFILNSRIYEIQQIFSQFQQLSKNLQRHKLLDLIEPYEQIFKDHVIKLRSFPISLFNMTDSEIVLGFYHQIQSTLLFMKESKKKFYGFEVFHQLNSTKAKFNDIVLNLMNNDKLSPEYYMFLNQVSESLINFQNILDLAFKIEKDSNYLLDIEKLFNKD